MSASASESSKESLSDLRAGQIFENRYEIIEVLGRGGVGVVYKAMHQRMEKIVAIKTLRSMVVSDDEESFRRFEQEAKTASSLSHPNIIAIMDFGKTPEDLAFLIMEYLGDQTLEAILIAEKYLEIDRFQHIAEQICEGLQHAHRKGIIHRDLKPSNIMLVQNEDATDLVKIVDFGLAKLTAIENSQHLTKTGTIVGTPLYMSPEQCRGLELDNRSDIYSLGCLFYTALTGHLPIHGATALDTLYQHTAVVPRAFSEVCPEIVYPTQLEKVIFKALEKDPADRQQTALELRDQIKAAVAQAKKDPAYMSSVAAGAARKAALKAQYTSFKTGAEDGSDDSLTVSVSSDQNLPDQLKMPEHSGQTFTPDQASVLKRLTVLNATDSITLHDQLKLVEVKDEKSVADLVVLDPDKKQANANGDFDGNKSDVEPEIKKLAPEPKPDPKPLKIPTALLRLVAFFAIGGLVIYFAGHHEQPQPTPVVIDNPFVGDPPRNFPNNNLSTGNLSKLIGSSPTDGSLPNPFIHSEGATKFGPLKNYSELLKELHPGPIRPLGTIPEFAPRPRNRLLEIVTSVQEENMMVTASLADKQFDAANWSNAATGYTSLLSRQKQAYGNDDYRLFATISRLIYCQMRLKHISGTREVFINATEVFNAEQVSVLAAVARRPDASKIWRAMAEDAYLLGELNNIAVYYQWSERFYKNALDTWSGTRGGGDYHNLSLDYLKASKKCGTSDQAAVILSQYK